MRHEFHATDYVIYAAIHFYRAAEGSLYQPPRGSESAGHPGVSQAPSFVQQ
jgi:hypothetical protein